MMAVNKPVGDNARKGAVKKRTQLGDGFQGRDETAVYKTVAAFIRKRGPRPEAVAARAERVRNSPFIADLNKVHAGEMTEAEFRAKWEVR